MNRSFTDAQLNPGVHANDLPATLPDPTTGVPPASGGIKNPFFNLLPIYQVTQWSIPPSDPLLPGSPATGAPFNPTRVVTANNPYQYKRIDVTVTSNTGLLGIGARASRVSGCLANPAPAQTAADCGSPGVICSAVDPGP